MCSILQALEISLDPADKYYFPECCWKTNRKQNKSVEERIKYRYKGDCLTVANLYSLILPKGEGSTTNYIKESKFVGGFAYLLDKLDNLLLSVVFKVIS